MLKKVGADDNLEVATGTRIERVAAGTGIRGIPVDRIGLEVGFTIHCVAAMERNGERAIEVLIRIGQQSDGIDERLICAHVGTGELIAAQERGKGSVEAAEKGDIATPVKRVGVHNAA